MSASCAPRSVSALVAVDARAPPACLFFLLKPCHDHARRIRLRFAGGTTTAGWSGETSPPSARSASGLSGARSPLPSSWGFAPHPPWSGTSAPPSRTPGSGSACAVRAEVATTELWLALTRPARSGLLGLAVLLTPGATPRFCASSAVGAPTAEELRAAALAAKAKADMSDSIKPAEKEDNEAAAMAMLARLAPTLRRAGSPNCQRIAFRVLFRSGKSSVAAVSTCAP